MHFGIFRQKPTSADYFRPSQTGEIMGTIPKNIGETKNSHERFIYSASKNFVPRYKIKSINKFKLRVSFGTCSYSVQQNFN